MLLDGALSAYLAGEFIEHEDDARDLRVALDGVGAKLLRGDALEVMRKALLDVVTGVAQERRKGWAQAEVDDVWAGTRCLGSA